MGKVKFAKLNVLENEENRHLAIKFGVMSTPTLIFFCEGRPVNAALGFQPKEILKKLVEDVLEKSPECIAKSTKIQIE